MNDAAADAELAIVEQALARLQFSGELRDCAVLHGGISGAHVYRIDTGAGQVVLKLTLAGAEGYVYERARRELEFYRQLASRISLAVPRVLGLYADDSFGCAVLLALYRVAELASEWDEGRYAEATAQLGQFHGQFWNATDELSTFAWLRRRQQGQSRADEPAARAAWTALHQAPRLAGVFNARVKDLIERLLDRIEAVDAGVQSLPATLCHGDCHLGNLLRNAAGDLVWGDWQEVAVARGPEDLSFLFQRAAAAGGTVPYDAAITSYHAALASSIRADVAVNSIRQVIDAAELRTRLLYWPAYLLAVHPAQMQGMLERIELLADRLKLN